MSDLTRADILAVLSTATDLATGQPESFALKSCALSMRIGEQAGLTTPDMAQVFHQALLRYIGCNADTYLMSALFGDEMAFRHDFALIDAARPVQIAGVVARALRRQKPGAGAATLAIGVLAMLAQSRTLAPAVLGGHCEVASRLAIRLGLGESMAANLGQLYERWDGKGIPNGLKGEALALPVRVVTLAQDAIVLAEAHGLDAALALIGQRRGRVYDPHLVDRFLPVAQTLMAGLQQITPEQVLALEPGPKIVLDAKGLDAACLVLADMVDMRMPETAGHSRAVADLCAAAAKRLRRPAGDVALIRRAGLLHDIGELAVPVSVWRRPGAFSRAERDMAELHPYHGERLLARPDALRAMSAVVGHHHERLDGSGYHRGCRAPDLPVGARILAAAEAFQSWLEPRPHRTALRPDVAAARLNLAIRRGTICPEAGAAVLEAAGQRATARPAATADLTPRETEVLRQLVAGQTIKGVALALGVAPKTADNHVQNLYSKLAVSSRAAAVLWAVEHGLHHDLPTG